MDGKQCLSAHHCNCDIGARSRNRSGAMMMLETLVAVIWRCCWSIIMIRIRIERGKSAVIGMMVRGLFVGDCRRVKCSAE